MERERVRYHLTGPGFSGRGVELVELDPMEIEKAGIAAAKELGKETSRPELMSRITQECLNRMIRSVTKKGGLKTLDSADWVNVTQQQLEDDADAFYFGKLFRSKDAQIMRTIHRKWHDATDAELDAIEGGAQAVSEG